MFMHAPYHVSAWHIPTTTYPIQNLESTLSIDGERRALVIKQSRLPAIVIEDTSLDLTLDDSLDDSLLRTPRRMQNTDLTNSPALSWLDEQTLLNPPCTMLYKEDALCSTPKRTLRSRKASIPSLITLKDDFPSITLLECHPNEQLDRPANSSFCQVATKLSEDHPQATATPPSTRRHWPKLRRSNGTDDLRTLYHCSASTKTADQTDDQAAFEQQLTLAILAEMDRTPARFLVHPRSGGQSRLDSGRSMLSTLGNLFRRAGHPLSRVF
ncbi:hypothetical protein BC835DRAFT_1341979 [Cytidiella melzeri]|nr:hypothetical protein BC835DRAFT_1341979 [Cytidiella melzeri]